MGNKYRRRVFISYDNVCPMKCKHCYTYELKLRDKERNVDQLLTSISDKDFDIIYLSKSYENFYKEKRGIVLCKALWEQFHKDIFIITRKKLSDEAIKELAELNHHMKESGNGLYLGVSISAIQSSSILENQNYCSKAIDRLSNLERAKKIGIKTVLVLRPLFPDNIISVEEPLSLIEKSKSYIDAVVTSGLIVTDKILYNLNLKQSDMNYLEEGDSDYLADMQSDSIKYVDVRSEIKRIKESCCDKNIPFFEHSLPALNAISY